jgi:phenylalanyl-tRNA synthetase alpha chain
MEQIRSQIDEAIAKINNANSLAEIQELKVLFLGKNGLITKEMSTLGAIPHEERKQKAAILNKFKEDLLFALDNAVEKVNYQEINDKIKNDTIDVTLPSRHTSQGKIHLLSHTINEVIEIFGSMGFGIEYGREIEDEFHNFSALNFPEDHPAKQSHDTFYMKNRNEQFSLLRTQTSTVQIRAMRNAEPPFKFISVGRVYRCDYDQTHTPMFHQVEGVYIDKNINMGHLKGCLKEFCKKFFLDDNPKMRFRPHFFPFTEPSAEVDILMNGGDKFLEILGCGMVHPNVLKNVGIDPEIYQGFAFGMGIERITMLKHNISDLRTFFEGDMRWVDNYGIDFYRIPKLIWGLER